MKNEIESMKSQDLMGYVLKAAPSVKKEHSQVRVWMPTPAPPTKVGDIRNSGEMEIKHYTVSKLSSDSSKGKSREKDQQLSRI